MRFYDTLFLRQHTRRLMFVHQYSVAFNEFYKDLDQGFVDPLVNFNLDAPTYWKWWNKSCEICDWCFNNEIHPRDFWTYAYQVIQDTGNGTKSFNTFSLPWVLEGVIRKKAEDDKIELCECYTLDVYTPGNPYFFLYYQALVARVQKKYGAAANNVLTAMITSGKIHAEVIVEYGALLGIGG